MVMCIFSQNIHSVYAQVPTSVDGVNISMNIENPRPGQSVEISLESYLLDLNSSSIVWLVNSKTQNQGIGLKKISIIAPKVGIKSTITAVIRTPDGIEVRKSISIKTGSVEILWETEGHSHPFYKGKLPFVYQNKVKLIAIPHLSKDGVREIDPKTLVYSWKNNGKYVENGQGYGKQSIEIQGSEIPKPLEISVNVYNREQTDNSTGYMILEPTDPSISFYEDDLLYGLLFNNALTDKTRLNNTEMRVLAVPYGFNINKNYSHAWSINNIEQPDLIRNRSIIIKTKGDTDGSSNISLDVRNIEDILQGARSEFTVYFNKNRSEENTEEIIF